MRNLPNLITALRMLLVVPLCWLIANARYEGALVVAAIAGLSDAVDGFLAKRYGWQSWLGGILDPIADKLLLMAAFLWLAFAGDVPAWLAALVIGRDLVIVGGAIAYYWLIGRFDAAPTLLSKLTTLVQIVFVLGELLRLSDLVEMPDAVREAAIAVTALLTVASGAHYVIVWSVRAWRNATTRERRQP
jgi:cardiolipin synthase